MKRLLQILSFATIILGIYICIHFLFELKLGWLQVDKSGQIGDFIGGVVGTIFSLSAFLLLALTFYEQTNFSKKERFESKFFDLLKLHRENVLELENGNKNGRKELNDIFNQFLDCREECKPFFNKKKAADIYNPKYLKKLEAKIKITSPNLNLLDCAKLDIPYIITFFGLNAQGRMSIIDIFEHKYKKAFYEQIIEYMAMKPISESNFFPNWKKINNLTLAKKDRVFLFIREMRNNPTFESDDDRLFKIAQDNLYGSDFVKCYGGHQYKLGHYFRHLFLTFTFINEQKILTKNEKYFYAKILRAQLSTSEQGLLFINSLSSLGLVWDINPKVKKRKYDPCYSIRVRKKRLITKYNLIKNLAVKEVFGIIYKDFYPEVNFEIDNLE
jgi:hypothetical protein